MRNDKRKCEKLFGRFSSSILEACKLEKKHTRCYTIRSSEYMTIQITNAIYFFTFDVGRMQREMHKLTDAIRFQ